MAAPAPSVVSTSISRVYFIINGDVHSILGSDVTPSTTLNDYIREIMHLRGTKAMCGEGGCGACIVSVTVTHPVTKEKQIFAVNSCLVHVLSCHQWEIQTIEGTGNRHEGFHPIQRRLASFNATQCGYCTPGVIMNMFSIYEKAKKLQKPLTMEEIEWSFGGNLCRCTGYRPILDACKSFAEDCTPDLTKKVKDIEDLQARCQGRCSKRCSRGEEWQLEDMSGSGYLHVVLKTGLWYKAFTIEEVFTILDKEGTDSYMLIGGNTGKGIYNEPEPRVLIDISSVAALRDVVYDHNLVLGAGVTLTEWMDACEKYKAESEDFKYLKHFYDHLNLVAHVPVRNSASIGGNLAMKNAHHDFPSDIYILLQIVGATVAVMDRTMAVQDVTMEDFLAVDLKGKLLVNLKLPPLDQSHLIRTYKIMPRAQNAHAVVNAGFHFHLNNDEKIVSAIISYGNIGPTFSRAYKTEAAIKGCEINTDSILVKAYKLLKEELVPVESPPEPSADCRKTLALSLFYAAVLSMNPECAKRYRSATELLKRGISCSRQTYATDVLLYPLTKPALKIEALAQCTGEVHYAIDVTPHPKQVHVAFVLATVSGGVIEDIDQNPALLPGVVAVLTAGDIPGKNTFTPLSVPWMEVEEEILASKNVRYYGQPVAIVAANTHRLALKAALLVKVTYTATSVKPVLTIQDALNSNDSERRLREDANIKPEQRGTDIRLSFSGTFNTPSQYHYYLEPQSCSVVSTTHGVRVRCASQWMDLVHVAVAQCLGIAENKVEVVIPRVGGSFGGKASRSSLIACACALAAYRLHRDASMSLPMQHTMQVLGMRSDCHARYEVGVNHHGIIQYLDLTCYTNCGYCYNDSSMKVLVDALTNKLYASERWHIRGYSVLTDTASNTWCRAPGTTEATAIMEHIMERIAYTLKRDPIRVRISNISPVHESLKELIETFFKDVNIMARREDLKIYNKDNAWRKKGLGFAVMSFPLHCYGNYGITISVYHVDGSVAISHGGVEMGQGINTKIAQVVAYKLQIALSQVAVRYCDNFVSPNVTVSNGSYTTSCVAIAAIKACEKLMKRLNEVKRDMKGDKKWVNVVQAAFEKGVNLQASYMMSTKMDAELCKSYNIYGMCACEVELDVLTGQHIVRRVDILEDTGVSMNPELDVGQIEGGFTMGLGMWTCERLQYEPTSGALLTDRTWFYKPCGARDVPEEFNVSFYGDGPNDTGVLRAKATGEPPLTLAVAVIHGLHDCIMDARKEYQHYEQEWITVKNPYNIENILYALEPKLDAYKVNA